MCEHIFLIHDQVSADPSSGLTHCAATAELPALALCFVNKEWLVSDVKN